jgi:hypothetical protein
MSFPAKEAPEEMIDKRTPFSRAKSLAAYCRSSAFDQSDGPMLALEFEGLASAIAAAHLAGRLEQAREDAEISMSHKGSARQERSKRRRIDPEAIDEILVEERGEDIAAEMIATAIIANIAKLKDEARASTKEGE